MSKRKQTRARAAQRQQAKKQSKRNQYLIFAGIAIAIVAAVVLLAPSSGALSGPEVAESRLDLDPVLGSPDAPVTIIEYAAYSCTACRSWHEAGIIEQILREYPGQVKFIHRDFPVISPVYDRRAAEIAQCALDQGEDQFWTFHDALFDRFNARDSKDTLLQMGADVGLDYDELKTCADNNTHRATVQYDQQRGNELGLRGTPAFMINDTLLYGATPTNMRDAINQALASS